MTTYRALMLLAWIACSAGRAQQPVDAASARREFEIANRYYLGIGARQDYAEALKWYRAAAGYGSLPSDVAVGAMLQNGEGTAKNPTEAAKWYRKAADQGYALAYSYLGHLYEDGIGVIQNDVTAADWCRRAADRGNAGAQVKLAVLLWHGRGVKHDTQQMFELLREAADAYECTAENILGSFAEKGLLPGGPKGASDALHWHRKAAAQDLEQAELALGVFFEDGRFVRTDFAEAAMWYRKAAEEGSILAQYRLARLYSKAQDVPPDPVQAYMWGSLAASRAAIIDRQEYEALRSQLARKMTPAQIAQGDKLANDWKPVVTPKWPEWIPPFQVSSTRWRIRGTNAIVEFLDGGTARMNGSTGHWEQGGQVVSFTLGGQPFEGILYNDKINAASWHESGDDQKTTFIELTLFGIID